ncbi:hypothetical protein ACFVHQ_13375 [Actinomycetes bacterium NPDC127524]
MVFITVILLGIVIGYPIWDYFYMKYGDFSDKRRMYVKAIVPQWTIVGIFFIFWLVTHRSWGALFYVDDPILHNTNTQTDWIWGVGEGAVLGIGLYILLFLISKKIRGTISGFIENSCREFYFCFHLLYRKDSYLFWLQQLQGSVKRLFFAVLCCMNLNTFRLSYLR